MKLNVELSEENVTKLIKFFDGLSVKQIRDAGMFEVLAELYYKLQANPNETSNYMYIYVPANASGRGYNNIVAIKTIRAILNIGLKEAKDLVDEAFRKQNLSYIAISKVSPLRVGPFKVTDIESAKRNANITVPGGICSVEFVTGRPIDFTSGNSVTCSTDHILN